MGADFPDVDGSSKRFIDAAEKLEMFVIQSSTAGDFSEVAHAVIPAATHAEQTGTYINVDGVVQSAYKAFEPAGQALPDWAALAKIAAAMNTPLSFDDVADIRSELFEREAAE